MRDMTHECLDPVCLMTRCAFSRSNVWHHTQAPLMTPIFECSDSPSPADLAVVDVGLDQFNLAEPELRRVKPLAVFARGATGRVVGGAVGRTWGLCCELQQLWTIEEARSQGIGTELMNRFETEATRRACSLIYLDTFSFQARPFYENRGYRVVLETQGFTNGIVTYSMRKQLAPACN